MRLARRFNLSQAGVCYVVKKGEKIIKEKAIPIIEWQLNFLRISPKFITKEPALISPLAVNSREPGGGDCLQIRKIKSCHFDYPV